MKNLKSMVVIVACLALAGILAACSQAAQPSGGASASSSSATASSSATSESVSSSSTASGSASSSSASSSAQTSSSASVAAASSLASANDQGIPTVADLPNVRVQFGTGGASYMMVPERNDAALTLIRNIPDAGLNLPIYKFDGFENSDVLQYYDVSSRVSVPADGAQQVASERVGEVYFSAPDRIILFYRDAEVPGSYVKVGELADASGLAAAVEDNPTVPGYGNKIIRVERAS